MLKISIPAISSYSSDFSSKIIIIPARYSCSDCYNIPLYQRVVTEVVYKLGLIVSSIALGSFEYWFTDSPWEVSQFTLETLDIMQVDITGRFFQTRGSIVRCAHVLLVLISFIIGLAAELFLLVCFACCKPEKLKL